MSATSPAAGLDQPAFQTAAGCREWLERAPKTDAAQLQAMFLRQINLLNRVKLAADVRMDILELLRTPIRETQEESARKFAGKPLPLAAQEQSAFDACRALWRGLMTGYSACAEACFSSEPDMKPRAALALQRALAALVAEQFETHRAGWTPTAEHWRVLHQLYAAAEQLGVVDREVADPLRPDNVPGSVSAAYAEALLLQTANLHELSLRQCTWVARWAHRWAAKVRVLNAPPTLSTQAFPLCVDIGSDQPAGYRPLDAAGARWIETAELRRSLKKRITLLDQGEAPAKLSLGDDCTQPACGQLLKNMYQRWCKGGAIRGFERRPANGNCRFIAGTEAIHYYLSGSKPFRPPGTVDADMLRRQRDELATFGRVATHQDEHFSTQHGFSIEDWQVLENWHMVDASATGMRVGRPVSQTGARIAAGNLIASCPANAQDFLLGCVRWSLVTDPESLQAGVLLFPGRPEPVAVRSAMPAGDKFRQGFLLPAVPTLRQEASIVLPVGMFKLDRQVEVFTGQTRTLRLTRLIERGADFERAAYAA